MSILLAFVSFLFLKKCKLEGEEHIVAYMGLYQPVVLNSFRMNYSTAAFKVSHICQFVTFNKWLQDLPLLPAWSKRTGFQLFTLVFTDLSLSSTLFDLGRHNLVLLQISVLLGNSWCGNSVCTVHSYNCGEASYRHCNGDLLCQSFWIKKKVM